MHGQRNTERPQNTYILLSIEPITIVILFISFQTRADYCGKNVIWQLALPDGQLSIIEVCNSFQSCISNRMIVLQACYLLETRFVQSFNIS